MSSITEDLDAIAGISGDIRRLEDKIRALRIIRENAERRVSDTVEALVRRCEDDPQAGAREMRAAMAGREAEASRALGRHSVR